MKQVILFLALFAFCSSSFSINRIEGKIQSIDLDTNTYTIISSSNGELHKLEFKDSTIVRHGNQRSKDLSALNIGDTVIYKKKDKHESKKTYVDVIIQSVDNVTKKITFMDKEGEVKTLRYKESARVDGGGYRSQSIESLNKGEKVQLKIQKVGHTQEK